MSFDLEKIFASKRAFRQRLAARPIEEKLSMLDALRERTLAFARCRPSQNRAHCMKNPRLTGCPARNQNETETR